MEDILMKDRTISELKHGRGYERKRVPTFLSGGGSLNNFRNQPQITLHNAVEYPDFVLRNFIRNFGHGVEYGSISTSQVLVKRLILRTCQEGTL